MLLFSRVLAFSSLFMLGLAFLAGSNAARAFDDEEDKLIKAAQKDILDLMKTLEGGKDGADKVKAIKKKYKDLFPIMQIYKPSTKGGLGYEGGPKGPGDSIEQKLISLEKRLSATALSKEKQALIKTAYLNIALAEIAKAYPPAKAVKGKGMKEWNQYSADQKKASLEFMAAVKEGNVAKVKMAAGKINKACDKCHEDFRD